MTGLLRNPDEMPRLGGWLVLAGLVAVNLAIGYAGSLVTAPAIPGWYAGLEKPVFNPPSWVFGPVWTALYVLIAVAAWRIWLRPASAERDFALVLYGGQLVLNALWSPAFFGLESPLLGMVVIVPLWLAILMTIRAFARLDRPASLMLWPYLAWVSYATLLNGAILALNPPGG